MAIAFFDLDKTLLAVNSATLWVRYALRHGLLRRRDALQAMAWLVRYRLGAANFDAPLRRSIATLAGSSEAAMRLQCTRFFHTQLQNAYRPGGLEAIGMHRLAGDTVVLLTSSTNYIADFVSRELDLATPLCTRLETDSQGNFTGLPIEPLSYGQGKLQLAQHMAQSMQTSLAACTFYSDSAADLPVFLAIGTPVVINPDPRLKRHARRHGWPIRDWGRPAWAATPAVAAL